MGYLLNVADNYRPDNLWGAVNIYSSLYLAATSDAVQCPPVEIFLLKE